MIGLGDHGHIAQSLAVMNASNQDQAVLNTRYVDHNPVSRKLHDLPHTIFVSTRYLLIVLAMLARTPILLDQ